MADLSDDQRRILGECKAALAEYFDTGVIMLSWHKRKTHKHKSEFGNELANEKMIEGYASELVEDEDDDLDDWQKAGS